ncbi:MAG: hypothetical protein AUI14_02690 [Actinobacteria bacterium 13_2_20CM_2_71_6]|nr:MAG: hypothetical protein AUI14_02690 [Actinobacteria bacterium 13_2_20CM_2_71_6]
MSMAVRTRRRGRTSVGGRLQMQLDIDLHGYVLARLDDHLAAMSALRHELAVPRPLRPGSRWQLAAATALAAQWYAHDLTRALGTADQPDGQV